MLADTPKSRTQQYPYRVHTFALAAGATEKLNYAGSTIAFVKQSAALELGLAFESSGDLIPVIRGSVIRTSGFREAFIKNVTGTPVTLSVVITDDPQFLYIYLDTGL